MLEKLPLSLSNITTCYLPSAKGTPIHVFKGLCGWFTMTGMPHLFYQSNALDTCKMSLEKCEGCHVLIFPHKAGIADF
jgi:hypothetical protein